MAEELEKIDVADEAEGRWSEGGAAAEGGGADTDGSGDSAMVCSEESSEWKRGSSGERIRDSGDRGSGRCASGEFGESAKLEAAAVGGELGLRSGDATSGAVGS